MATFPHSLCGIRQDGHGEQHMPMVLRSDMERGIPKQRRAGADVLVRVPCSLVFRSAADAAAFESWFYAEGMGWFDFTLPRTGAVVQARIIGGDIGSLVPLTPAWNASERSIVLEYIRPNFITLAPGSYSIDSSRILSVQRASSATYIDAAGVLQTAPANVARYQGGQLLVEGWATNLLRQTEALTSSPWTNAWGTTSTVSDAGSGLTVGKRFLVTATSANGGIRQVLTGLASGARHAWSFYVESTASSLGFRNENGGATYGVGLDCSFNPVTGSFSAVNSKFTCTASQSGPGWLVKVLFPPAAAALGVNLEVRAAASGSSFIIGRPQFEAGSAPTSYIPTTTTAATRAADLITVAA